MAASSVRLIRRHLLALRSLFEVVGSGGRVHRVNCHHNFTQRETHLGQSL
ncbi:MAG: hypothetical protein JWL79_2093 [Frankiales bacterium]|nr:hypothetical protein [Frankiales bacterium]